ncbi:hypothetical protein Taro_031905 [Colocasia esculenta]|uniref:Guanine nucleotide-binding protein alpha subunit n=1 Tax=Colocasia esculenta TaxID=4460 RepID=A0A843W096_COLES|nr:hypothetical protein [Colocasia esculenta]
MLFEDESKNRMMETKELFDWVLKQPCFEKTSFMLFLNKFDIFEEKVLKVPLNVCEWFKDYRPMSTGKQEVEHAYEFVKKKFEELYFQSTSPDRVDRVFKVYRTTALDQKLVKKTFKLVWADLAPLLQFKNMAITNVADGIISFLTHPTITTAEGRLMCCTFMAVLWEIWCSRNMARFQGRDMSAKHIINRSMLSVRAICTTAHFQKISQPWLAALCQSNSRNEIPNVILPKAVRWITPPRGRLKLNVDGAFNMMSDEAGGGGILRDHKGNMCCAFVMSYHDLKSSLEAEAVALRDGLSMCCIKGFKEVMVEIDSLNLLHIVTNQLQCPWELSLILQGIATLIKRVKAEISHVPWEGNKVADCLAGFALSCVHLTTWDSWADLPNTGRDPYRLDKVGCPSIEP